MNKYTVLVVVEQTAETLSDPYDREDNPAGEYAFDVKALGKNRAIEKALDLFNKTVHINERSDFEVTAEIE